jgi:hypothetical protein
MFDPINKTISELREEIVAHIGKEVSVTGSRRKVTIESVGECDIDVIPKNGDYRETLKKNWEKKGKKMYGFTVIVYYMEAGFGNDKKYTYPERIYVPFEIKDKKIRGSVQCIMHETYQISILK